MRMTRVAGTAVAAIAIAVLGVASTAQAASTAQHSGSTSGGAITACEWTVVWPTAGVYEKPTRMNPPLKDKHSGDHVGGGYCMSHYNESEGETYVSVTCDCAEDGIGWMRRNALNPA